MQVKFFFVFKSTMYQLPILTKVDKCLTLCVISGARDVEGKFAPG